MSSFLLANGSYMVGFAAGLVCAAKLRWQIKAAAICFAMAAIPALIEVTGGFR